MVCWVGWKQLREMVWYGAGIRKLGDGNGMVIGGGTETKGFHPIPSHSHPILMGIPSSQNITTSSPGIFDPMKQQFYTRSRMSPWTCKKM